MKNKRAVQMMTDMGNTDLAIFMIHRIAGSMCHQMKSSGTYEVDKHFPENIKKATKRFSHMINVKIIGDPIQCGDMHEIELEFSGVEK